MRLCPNGHDTENEIHNCYTCGEPFDRADVPGTESPVTHDEHADHIGQLLSQIADQNARMQRFSEYVSDALMRSSADVSALRDRVSALEAKAVPAEPKKEG